VPIASTALQEGFSVSRIQVSRIEYASLPISRDTIALHVTKVGTRRRQTSPTEPHEARFDDCASAAPADGALSGSEQSSQRSAAANPASVEAASAPYGNTAGASGRRDHLMEILVPAP
jgi:hypothetical protein